MSEINAKNTTDAVFVEDKENTPEVVENVAEREKPYNLRELCAEDVFPMLNILKKIGIKEFKECFSKETIENIVGMFVGGTNAENKSENDTMVAVGISILPSVLEIADVLIGNLSKCDVEIYKFLDNVSDLSVDQIKKLKMADFFEMIVDVLKKEEFKDFFKVVSRLFK
jgi:hypothetical protein